MDISELKQFTKPLLMPLLAYIYYRADKSKTHKSVFIALLFAWLGDIFLMFSGQNFFLLGLSAFLIGHLTYSYIFSQNSKFRLIGLPPITAYALMFSILILQDAIPSEMRIPVYIYIGAISLMTFMASARIANPKSYGLVLSGAVLFMLSDSVIALDVFMHKVTHDPVWVMSTYGLGQFLIIMGLVKENEPA
ncbi:lysoplasmalogenase [Jiulongibacter sediminis]|uniref:lysoplasmalogenase n=1 Tax=Jiulongibacter sediminis TaxID=1605367 RepID=UPI0026EC9529|nr:lysoplasmalogenase [Jiulongibacter sediminis]